MSGKKMLIAIVVGAAAAFLLNWLWLQADTMRDWVTVSIAFCEVVLVCCFLFRNVAERSGAWGSGLWLVRALVPILALIVTSISVRSGEGGILVFFVSIGFILGLQFCTFIAFCREWVIRSGAVTVYEFPFLASGMIMIPAWCWLYMNYP